MKKLGIVIGVIGMIALVTSCSTSSRISENDVYLQAPTIVNLEEAGNDMTSFNAFKAGKNGAFQNDYQQNNNFSPRFNLGFAPFGMGLGYFNNSPMAFAGGGYGMYDPFYNPFRYNNYGYGYGYNPYGYNPYAMGGFGNYYDPFYNPYYGYGGYNPYYGGYGMNSPYYGYGSTNYCYDMYGNIYPCYSYGNPYYNTGNYAGNYNGGNLDNSAGQNVFYGKRTGVTTSSARSSVYPNTLKSAKSTLSPVSESDQTMGTSRRGITTTSASNGSDYTVVSAPTIGTATPIKRGNRTPETREIKNAPVSSGLPSNTKTRPVQSTTNNRTTPTINSNRTTPSINSITNSGRRNTITPSRELNTPNYNNNNNNNRGLGANSWGRSIDRTPSQGRGAISTSPSPSRSSSFGEFSSGSSSSSSESSGSGSSNSSRGGGRR